MSDIEIRRVLVLSTAHVKPSTADHAQVLSIASGEQSSFYLVPPGPDELACVHEDSEIPQDLKGVVTYAYRVFADLVMLDPDGPVIDGLPTYHWE